MNQARMSSTTSTTSKTDAKRRKLDFMRHWFFSFQDEINPFKNLPIRLSIKTFLSVENHQD